MSARICAMLVSMGLGLVLGLGLATASIAGTRVWARRRARGDEAKAVRIEVRSWALYLVVAALIYVGFALREGGDGWMAIEIAGVVGYGALAIAGGSRHPRLVAVGWVLHMAWDVVVHRGVADEFVPTWYRWACLVYDVVAGLYVWRISTRRP